MTTVTTIGYQAATVGSFLEADPAHGHRGLVVAALGALVQVRIVHLMPVDAT